MPKRSIEGLTIREEKFVECYCDGKTITESAKLAGCSERSAGVTGSRMLKRAKIQEAIEKKRAEMSKEAFMNRKEYTRQTFENYQKETARDVRRKYWDLLGDLLGHKVPEGSTTVNLNTLSLWDLMQLDKKLKEQCETVPKEIQDEIDGAFDTWAIKNKGVLEELKKPSEQKNPTPSVKIEAFLTENQTQ